jgi:hypothetical protein
MRRTILGLGLLLATAGVASAQYPTQPYPGGYGPAINPGDFMPNIYNPRSQPLSPYLNLLRNADPGTNYYYNVRPGTVGMGARSLGGPAAGGVGGNRPVFFPQLAAAPDPLGGSLSGPGDVLPPAGHPVVFGNTMGFFPSPVGQAGGSRGGLSGLGNTRPPAKK